MIRVKDKTIKLSLEFCLLFLVGQLVILVLFWQKLPPQVPLFYSRPWGEEQLVSPIKLLILPAITFLITLVNSVATSLIPGEEKLPGQLLMVFAAVVSFLSLVTLFKIVTLIT